MCEICRQNPCHPQCPNAEEVIIDRCIICKDNIILGQNYYELYPDGLVCDDCVEEKYNDDPDKPDIVCDDCGKSLEYDEKYYIIDNKKHCTNCVKKCYD